jgi:hypothetical protein
MTSSGYQGRGEPSNVRSIEDRIRRIAAAQDLPANRVRHRLAVVVLSDLLSGLEIDGETPTFLVKGGTVMMIRFGIRESRFSRDLDAMLSGAMSPTSRNCVYAAASRISGSPWKLPKTSPLRCRA